MTTREEVLISLGKLLEQECFAPIDVIVPRYKVAPSFAFKGGANVRGQCISRHCTADDVAQVVISPFIDNLPKVAATMLHELIHVVDFEAGHGPRFRALALRLGFEKGSMRSTTPTAELAVHLESIAARVGPYPHAKVDFALGRSRELPSKRVADGPSSQEGKGRLLKVACPHCTYPARVTRVWLDRVGAPICPSCNTQMLLAPPGPKRPS
jgi:hypothetical protein